MAGHFYLPDGTCITGLREARKAPNALPSPTTVLKMLKGEGLIKYFQRQIFEATATTPRLPHWTDDEYFEACVKYSEEHGKAARDSGGDIHDIIQNWIASGSFPVGLPQVQEQQLSSYAKWHERYVARTLMLEKMVFGKGYAGRVDHVARLRDGRTAVCDVKSQDITKRKKFSQYPEHFLQLGAYAGTISPLPDVLINIYVSSKTPVVLESYTWPGSPRLGHELFLNLLRLWQFINNYQFQETSPGESLVGLLPFASLDETPSVVLSGSANANAGNVSNALDGSS